MSCTFVPFFHLRLSNSETPLRDVLRERRLLASLCLKPIFKHDISTEAFTRTLMGLSRIIAGHVEMS